MAVQDFGGRTAVITGAANGMGAALARHAASLGMNLILADIDTEGLARTGEAVRELGTAFECVPTDVSDPFAVEQLAAVCRARFGVPYLLCNQAGVLATAQTWRAPLEDWRWIMGVNFGGVVHTIRSFVPDMLASGQPGHVVNAASIGAVLTEPLAPAYTASLRAVLTLSESLQLDLRREGAAIGVSVVCAGAVATDLAQAERHRPSMLARPEDWAQCAAAQESFERKRVGIAAGRAPDELAKQIFEGIAAGRFWIFSPSVAPFAEKIRAATERMLEGLEPVEAFPPPPRPS